MFVQLGWDDIGQVNKQVYPVKLTAAMIWGR